MMTEFQYILSNLVCIAPHEKDKSFSVRERELCQLTTTDTTAFTLRLGIVMMRRAPNSWAQPFASPERS